MYEVIAVILPARETKSVEKLVSEGWEIQCVVSPLTDFIYFLLRRELKSETPEMIRPPVRIDPPMRTI